MYISGINRVQPADYLTIYAEKNPDSIFIDSYDSTITFAAAQNFVIKLSNYFLNIGVRRGNVIAINLPAPLHILFMLASWRVNAISAAYSQPISHQNIWNPEWIFSTNLYSKESAVNVILVDESLIASIEQITPNDMCGPYESEHEPLRVLFSSGTTGGPKGIPFTFKMLEIRSEVSLYLWRNQKPYMSLFDIGSLGGFSNFYTHLKNGETYLVPGNATQNAKQILKHKVAHIVSSPNQISGLLDLIKKDNYSISSLNEVVLGGSATSPKLAARIEDVLGAQVMNIYASTESGTVAFQKFNPSNPFEMGNIIQDVRVEIVDEFDQEVSEGILGKIRLQTPAQAPGYFRDHEATRKYFANGWFYPGDEGYLNSDQKLELSGRTSELVNMGGVKVDPVQIDQFVIGKYGVVDAGAFGFTGADGLENLGLAIMSDQLIVEELLFSELRSFFGHAVPKVIFRIESIPRNERGKVLRQELTRLYIEQR